MENVLGLKVRDRITGFEGMVTGRVQYITGCNQLLVQPPVKKKGGTFEEARWFDEDRMEAIPGKRFFLKVNDPGPDVEAPRK
jgi:hypothetical protein